MQARDVILAPLITEKSVAQTALSQYSFEVHPRATKTQIRMAVQEIFSVEVVAVNTVHVRGKSKNVVRRRTRTAGRTSDWKKAVVTIKPGQKIQLAGVNYFEQ